MNRAFKIVVISTMVFCFGSSNILYALPNNSTLRPTATTSTNFGPKIKDKLVEVFLANEITAEDVLAKKLIFADIKKGQRLNSAAELILSLQNESDRAYFSALYRQYKLRLLVENKARVLMDADASLIKDDAIAKATVLIAQELKGAGRDKDALILTDSKPLIIGENFSPSALLSDKDFRDKLGAVQYEDLEKDSKNIEAATRVTIVQNPLNGGIGQAMDRLGFLKTIWPETGRSGEPELGAKAMDCYFKVSITIRGQQKEAFVSVAEATILSLLYEVENGYYNHGILEEFISSETRQAMDDLKNTVYLYDRLDSAKIEKRTYGEILEEKNMLDIMPEQAMFPRFDVEDNYKLTDKYTAPGSHGHWGVYALSNMPDETLPQDGSTQIRTIFNGDGISNAPNSVIAGWMARENVPIVMITTTRAPIDVKGGMLGVEYLNGKKFRKNLLELADAKTNDKEHPGQAELFQKMGISKQDKKFGEYSKQLFNTNTVLLNDTVLQPFLRELRDILGIEEYNSAISPKMMMKAVTQKDGKEYVQLEGAMGSSMLSLAGFLSMTDDVKIKALCEKHSIERNKFLRLVNIDVDKRTDFFAPIKFPVDYWLQFFSDHFEVDTTTWKLKNLRPGHVPALDTPDQNKDKYYSNVLNLFTLFGDNGVIDKDNPVMTSTIGLDLLKIRGKAKLAGSVLKGNIVVINEGKSIADLTTGTIKRRLLQDDMASIDNGKLVLENVAIVIKANGKEIKTAKLQNKKDIDNVIAALVSHKAFSSGRIIPQIEDLLTQQIKVGFVDKKLLADIDYDPKGKFEMQINPARAPKDRGVVDEKVTKRDGPIPCFLCVENMPEKEKGIKENNGFTIYPNPRPIDVGHVVVATHKHKNQFITEESEISRAINYLDNTAPYTMFFNGEGAAASANHLHFQILNLEELNNRLPIESAQLKTESDSNGVVISTLKNYPARSLIFESKDKGKLVIQVTSFLKKLNSKGIPYNILFTRAIDNIARIFVFPRAIENPHDVDPKLLNIKFGTLEMAGLFIVYSKDMVEGIEEKLLAESLERASLSPEAFNEIVADVVKASSSGLTQNELKSIYDAQESKKWRAVQDAQQELKEDFLAEYADNWQKVKKEYPGIRPVFDPLNSGRQRIIFTPEMAKSFNITPREIDEEKKEKVPTGHFKVFYNKSDNSTAGVRDFYDPLHSENPDNMYNEAFMALLVQAEAEFLQDVHKELTAHLSNKGTKEFNDFIQKLRQDITVKDIAIIEEIYGMKLEDIVAFLKHNIVKLVGGEVRAHTAKFVEMETRILAENGITVLTAKKYSDSVPIYMFSFLTYILGASGATNNTPSHSSNYIFGRKALAPDGSQLLPDLYERYRNILDNIIENRIYGDKKIPFEVVVSRADNSHILKNLSYERMVRLYTSILNITPEDVALINKATEKGHKIVLNCLNGSTWKTLRVLLKELGINPEAFDLVMEEEDPYFNVGYIVTKSDDGIYGVGHLGVDTTMTLVANTIPYPSFLRGYKSGTRQYELDPDSDRFVLKQVLDNNEENRRLVKEYGIDFYELDDNKILIAPSPNKVFLNLDIADYERMVEAGTWDKFHSLYMITYVSSRAWTEFADAVDGLIGVMHRVGFKNFNDVQRVVQQWYDNKIPVDEIRKANDFIKDITRGEIVFYDQLGEEIAIDRSKRIRIHSKQEESGGRVAGMYDPSYNILGQSTIAMPEKSAADSLLSELIHASRLFLQSPENYSFLKFNDYAFKEKKFGLKSKIDARLDILHGNQDEIAKMPLEDRKEPLEKALLNKNNFNNFFFSIANAVKLNKISKDKAIEIFTAVLPEYADTWYCLDEIALAEEELSGGRTRPEGAPLMFKNKDDKVAMVTEFDFRPSGTDALKSKVYYDAEIAPDKDAIESYFMALTKYNLYEVLKHYKIESVLEEPADLLGIGLKSLVLGHGPAEKSSSSGLVQELKDAEEGLDKLIAQGDKNNSVTYEELNNLSLQFDDILSRAKYALMRQIETADMVGAVIDRDDLPAAWRGIELHRMLESIKAYKRLGEKVKIDTSITTYCVLPKKMGNRYAQNKDTAHYIKENLNHEFIFNDNVLQVVEHLKQKGVSEKDIFVYTFEQDKAKIDKMHKVLAGRRVLVLEDSKEPLLWPFQRLALTAKVILGYQDADNSQKGYYRNALNTLLKSLQDSTGINACIDNILRDPAKYVIRVLAAPVSVLKMYQRKRLTEKLNRIWA